MSTQTKSPSNLTAEASEFQRLTKAAEEARDRWYALTKARGDTIRRLRAAGHSHQQIADAVGMSRARIQQYAQSSK